MMILTQFVDLLTIQLKRIRNLGNVFVLMSIILPSGFLLSLKYIVGETTPERALFLISGNVLFSIINICLVSVGQNITFMKQIRSLEYYATLPINKLCLLFSIILSFFIVAIPGFVIVLILGALVFKYQLTVNLMLIPAILLIAGSFSGIGALIGIRSNDSMKSGLICQLIMFIIIFATPVFVALERLPKLIQYFSYLLPSTYGANLLRSVLLGQSNGMWLNITVLSVFTLSSIILLARFFEWSELD